MNNDKTKGATAPVQAVTPPNAWRISAPRGCKFELQYRDEAFAFEAVKPGANISTLSPSLRCSILRVSKKP